MIDFISPLLSSKIVMVHSIQWCNVKYNIKNSDIVKFYLKTPMNLEPFSPTPNPSNGHWILRILFQHYWISYTFHITYFHNNRAIKNLYILFCGFLAVPKFSSTRIWRPLHCGIPWGNTGRTGQESSLPINKKIIYLPEQSLKARDSLHTWKRLVEMLSLARRHAK